MRYTQLDHAVCGFLTTRTFFEPRSRSTSGHIEPALVTDELAAFLEAETLQLDAMACHAGWNNSDKNQSPPNAASGTPTTKRVARTFPSG